MTLPSSAAWAFSLNRYLYSHSGAVVRLRADNTSAEEDFQIVSGAIVTDDVSEDSVSTWVAAQAGNNGTAKIVTMYDHSGNARNITNAAAAGQAVFEEDGSGTLKNYADFDGSGDFYPLGDHLTLAGYTVLAALRIDSASNTDMIFGSNATDNNRWYHGVGNTSGQYFTRNSTAGYTSGGTVTTGSDILFTLRGASGTGSVIREDSSDQVTAASYTDTDTPAAQTIGQAGTQGFFFDGHAYEFIGWNSSLSDGDRNTAESDLDVYYFGGGGGGSTIPVFTHHYNQMRSV